MGKPRMIILVRHAQSEGNKNRDIHQSTPDHRVKLTSEGHRQAREAGHRLRGLLRPEDSLHFFTSPYRRTRETTEGILDSLTSDSPSPSPFSRDDIKVYEEPRLREQDFGNFQPCSKEMERMWMERADYGHFFYRIPNGESAADAYDRVSGFNETLWRLFGEDDCASVCVLVTHGLMGRVFLMKWYHWSVEHFEDLRNINHCEFVIMTHNQNSGKYELQNKLRTWSDMRKERDRERIASGLDPVPVSPTDNGPMRRKWGGCPDGCTHGLSADTKKSLRAKLVESKLVEYLHHDHAIGKPRVADDPMQNHGSNGLPDRPTSEPVNHAQDYSQLPLYGEETAKRPMSGDSSSDSGFHPPANGLSRFSRPSHLNGVHRNSEDHLLHPPSSPSSTACLKLAFLHLGGRDGGGSMSGANSLCPSDDESEDHENGHSPWIAPAHHSRRSVSTHAHPLSISNSPPRTQPSQAESSQELEDDGDDEAEGPRQPLHKHYHHHHHHHHHHHPPHTHHRHASSIASHSRPRMANILGDGDDLSTYSAGSNGHSPPTSEAHTAKQPHADQPDENLSLEAQRERDQSIRGSIY